jgi:hypothetical protein
MLSILITTLTFSPTIKLESGKSVTLRGTGPPVVFNGGWFGTMNWRLYSNLINDLKEDITVITPNGWNSITAQDVENIADRIGVNKIGFFAHSSFDKNILNSDKVESAFLVDPIVIPEISISGIEQSFVKAPIKILKAEKAYDSSFAIPEYLVPGSETIEGTDTFPGVGHADLLDDRWANLARTTGIWDSVKFDNFKKFEDWNISYFKSLNPQKNIEATRQKYRKKVSNECKDFFVKVEAPKVLVEVDEYPLN